MGLIFDEDNRLDLTRFDEDYSRIAHEADGWDTVPDGYYQVRVEDVRLTTTQTTGNPMLIWRLRIAGPAHAGSVLTKTRIITSKTLGQVIILKRWWTGRRRSTRRHLRVAGRM